jgi:hypothetical protein
MRSGGTSVSSSFSASAHMRIRAPGGAKTPRDSDCHPPERTGAAGHRAMVGDGRPGISLSPTVSLSPKVEIRTVGDKVTLGDKDHDQPQSRYRQWALPGDTGSETGPSAVDGGRPPQCPGGLYSVGRPLRYRSRSAESSHVLRHLSVQLSWSSSPAHPTCDGMFHVELTGRCRLKL